MGIFCIIAGIIIGAITGMYGSPSIPLIIQLYFFNTFSIFGYVFLGLGLIGFFLKRKFEKASRKEVSSTPHKTFREFVNHKTKEE